MLEGDTKQRILEFLKANKDSEFSLTEIQRRTEISMTSVSKWVQVLMSENMVESQIVGNVRIVKYKGDSSHETNA